MYRWLWTWVRRYGWLLVLGFFLTILAAALSMVNPVITGKIVDDVIQHQAWGLFWKLAAAMLGLAIVRVVLRYIFQMVFEHISQQVIKSMRESIFSNLQALDFRYFDTTKTGDIMAQMTGDVDAVRHFLAWVIYQILENFSIFAFSICVLFVVDWRMTLVLVAVTPFIAFYARSLSVKVKPTFHRIREQFSRLNSVVQENIAGNRVVKSFSREAFEIDKFERENLAFYDRNLESTAVWGKYIPLIEFFSGLMPVVLLAMGGYFIIKGYMSLGDLVIFSGLIWALSQPLRMSGWLINDFQRFVASCERLFKLAQTKAAIVNPPNPHRVDRLRGAIEFRSVDFSYGDERVLENISFKIEPGMRVGVIGPTGSGKSTITKLISRYYDADRGQVLVDGLDVKEYDLNSLRNNVGIAMQDVFLFSDTIEGNIAFGRPEAKFDEVQQAARLSAADGFISEMPQGYDTIIGERGVGLSGGQRQRIALARLLLKDNPIMILDDTTSAVDVETEERIKSSVASLHGKRTIIVIAHRISSVMDADLILVVRDGRVTECGDHGNLLRHKGYYAEVFGHQVDNRLVSHAKAALAR